MTQLTTGLWATIARYVQSWLLPSALAIGFFWIALLPAVDDDAPWAGLRDNAGWAFVVVTGLVSFLLASTARTLTRILEGYLMPSSLQKRWAEKQRERRDALIDEIEAANSKQEKIKLRTKLNRYPRLPEYVLPTRFGNAWRAGETYGWVQYGLSTVDLWIRLTAVVDTALNDALNEARGIVDFFVGAMWLSGFLAIMTAVVAVWSDDYRYLLWLVPVIGFLPMWYELSIEAVGRLSRGYMAIADLGRTPLAKALGLRLPGNLDEERALWIAVSDYASWGPDWEATDAWKATIDGALQPRGADLPAHDGPPRPAQASPPDAGLPPTVNGDGQEPSVRQRSDG